MGAKIYVQPNMIWQFFQQNKKRLESEMVVIAENINTEYAVYLTEDCTMPQFLVCKGDGSPEYKETANKNDCDKIAKKFYDTYLYPVEIDSDKYTDFEDIDDIDVNMTRQDMEDEQYERDDELRLALCDFLSVVFQEGNGDGTVIADMYGEDLIDEILDYFLEYIGFEYCIPIYRPMIITDEDTGCEIFTEYPYNDEYSEDDETTIQSR